MAPQLILASSSPFRRELLSRLGIPFLTLSPDIDESPHPGETPTDLVQRLASDKAKKIAADQHHALVIGSDQIAVHDGEIVGKPRDHEHAMEQLRSASGKSITLHTGLALVNTASGRLQVDDIPYTVQFRHLDEQQICRYLAKEKPYACSGSLRADGLGIALLQRFEGDDPNALIGLPLIRLVDMLQQEGISVV